MEKTLLIVDDHPLFRKALVNLAQDHNASWNVVPASSAEEGLQKLREHGRVDLILLDLGLPGVAGVDAVSLLRRATDAQIIIVSASENRPEISAAMRAGASSVVSKGASMETLREVLDQALLGSAPASKQWIRPTGSLDISTQTGKGLTARQQEIAVLLMNGHSNKEIGMRLGLAEITVKTHLTAIFRLLGVVNRTQAVIAIRRLGIEPGGGGGAVA